MKEGARDRSLAGEQKATGILGPTAGSHAPTSAGNRDPIMEFRRQGSSESQPLSCTDL